MGKHKIEEKEIPTAGEIAQFWKKEWSNKNEYNAETDRLNHEKLRLDEGDEQKWQVREAGKIICVLR